MIWLLFSPTGRISRASFIKAWVMLFCLNVGLLSGMFAHEYDDWLAMFTLLALVSIPVSLVALIMLGFKRLHDFNAPGPIAFVLAIPMVSLVAAIVLMAIPSSAGANDYGSTSDSRD